LVACLATDELLGSLASTGTASQHSAVYTPLILAVSEALLDLALRELTPLGDDIAGEHLARCRLSGSGRSVLDTSAFR
jgi:hypothetical protein